MSGSDPKDDVVEFDVADIDIDDLLRKCKGADAPVVRCAAAAMAELQRLNERWPQPLPQAVVALDLAVAALSHVLRLSLGEEPHDEPTRAGRLQQIAGALTALHGWCSQDALDAVTRSNQVIAYVLDATLTEGASRYAEHLRAARTTLGSRASTSKKRQSGEVRAATAIVHLTACRVAAFLGHPERSMSKPVLDAVRSALVAYRRYAFRKDKRKVSGSKWNYVAALIKAASDTEVTGFALRQGQSDHQGQIVGGWRARRRRRTK
jgi:hypothetical protein